MNLRLTITAAVAAVLASLSLSAVLAGNGWLGAGIGAVVVVAAAGSLTRMSALPSAVAATFLALIGVVPLLAGPTWPHWVAGLAIVVLTAASATGVRLLRGFAIIVTYLSSLLIYLNLLFAGAASFGHLLPSEDSLTLLSQLNQAAFSEFKFSPPVPDIRPVSLVAAGGIGLIAIVVDMLAVRLRRPAIAGLPLLLLFSVPVASNLKAFGTLQIVTFVAGLGGFLALLSVDGRERLRMWGRLVTFRYVQPADEAGDGPDTRDLAASGRRIGLAAMCLAVIVPLVLPSMQTHDVFGTTYAGNGRGMAKAQLNALLLVQNELAAKPQPVLTYTTSSADPQRQYLQQFVLNYNASQNRWSVMNSGAGRAPSGVWLPWSPAGVTAHTRVKTVRTTIQLDKDQAGEAVLPVPYAPVQLSTSTSGWLEEPDSLMIFNQEESPSGLRYTVVSREVTPLAAQMTSQPQMPANVSAGFGSYTGPDQSQLLAIADRHASGATELQQALNLQDWFTSGDFTYSLKPNLPATSGWLLTFLTTDRRGICSQFAWAFAILARLAGIPSRIVVGYTAGTLGPGGTWQVTTADAHAWPELYFPGDGWLRFEPTPGAVLHGQGTAVTPAYASGSFVRSQAPGTKGQPQPNLTGAAGPGHRPSGLNRLTHLAGTGAGSASQASGSALGFAIGIPVALFLLIAWPAVTRLLTRRRRWLAATGDAALAHAAWRELADDLADYGLGCAPGETARAVARRIAKEASLAPSAVQAITRIGTAEERARYARVAEPGAGLTADVRTVRRAVAASVTSRQRMKARFLPASTLLAARHLLQRAGDMLGWLDSSWPAVRQRLHRAVMQPGSALRRSG